MFEESRTAQSAAGPEIDPHRRREEELSGEVRRQKNDRAKIEAPLLRNRADLESHKSRRTAIDSQVTLRNYAIARISCETRFHPRFCHSRLEVWDESPRGND